MDQRTSLFRNGALRFRQAAFITPVLIGSFAAFVGLTVTSFAPLPTLVFSVSVAAPPSPFRALVALRGSFAPFTAHLRAASHEPFHAVAPHHAIARSGAFPGLALESAAALACSTALSAPRQPCALPHFPLPHGWLLSGDRQGRAEAPAARGGSRGPAPHSWTVVRAAPRR
jgi:hypothetical protein